MSRGFNRGAGANPPPSADAYQQGLADGINGSIAFLENERSLVSAATLRRGRDEGLISASGPFPDGTHPLVLASMDRPTRIDREAPRPVADFQPGPVKITREEAKGKGYTGNSCSNCGSMEMQIAGHCEVCSSCGTSSGCS